MTAKKVQKRPPADWACQSRAKKGGFHTSFRHLLQQSRREVAPCSLMMLSLSQRCLRVVSLPAARHALLKSSSLCPAMPMLGLRMFSEAAHNNNTEGAAAEPSSSNLPPRLGKNERAKARARRARNLADLENPSVQGKRPDGTKDRWRNRLSAAREADLAAAARGYAAAAAAAASAAAASAAAAATGGAGGAAGGRPAEEKEKGETQQKRANKHQRASPPTAGADEGAGAPQEAVKDARKMGHAAPSPSSSSSPRPPRKGKGVSFQPGQKQKKDHSQNMGNKSKKCKKNKKQKKKEVEVEVEAKPIALSTIPVPIPKAINTRIPDQLQCKHFSVCSGCSTHGQFDEVPTVNRAKSYFKSLGLVMPVHVADHGGYRTHVKLAVQPDPLRRIKIGLYKAGTHDVQPIPNCVVHHPRINEALAHLKATLLETGVQGYLSPQDVRSGGEAKGDLRYVQMSYNKDQDAVSIVLVWNAKYPEGISWGGFPALVKGLQARDDLFHSIVVNAQPSTNNDIINYDPAAWKVMYGPEHFPLKVGAAAFHFMP